MSLVGALVRAAHARGSHHHLALDALERMVRPDAEAWQRLFYAHAAIYCDGAKAPDTDFKDFKNHVLHPRDNYWGGAPAKATSWYHNLVDALKAEQWDTAIYCAGVLSHYCVDPLHPFHTAQSEAENNIHRALEWSIAKSYADLKRLGAVLPVSVIAVARSDTWLAQLICTGADRANTEYEKLIAHYDIHRGVVDPPTGLDDIARKIIAGLIGYASDLFAVVLDRAITESGVAPPAISLTPTAILAALKLPIKMITSRIADAKERRLVERMYDELKATGTVEINLPEDDRVVRDAYQREVVARRPQPNAAQVFSFEPRQSAITRIERERLERARQSGVRVPGEVVALARAAARDGAQAGIRAEPPRPAPPREVVVPMRARAGVAAAALGSSPMRGSVPPVDVPAAPIAPPAVQPTPVQAQTRLHVESPPVAAPEPQTVSDLSPSSPSDRIYLRAEDPVVEAPSIGPKMAQRLNDVGVDTVEELLRSHPIALAARLNDSRIKPETITDWQDQTRLVCKVPGLRGTHAQLLVGAGVRTVEALAGLAADELCARVLAFAQSADGQRILRDGSPPDVEKIKLWAENARRVHAA
jgi:hypothetical protein